MEQLNCLLQKRKGYVFLSFFLFFIFLVSLQSCSSQKDIAASLDDFNLIHKGPSYPNASYDNEAFFYNMFVEWLVDFGLGDFGFLDDIAEQTDHSGNTKLLIKLQYIKKGSQNKYANGKTMTKFGYIELPLYAVYQKPLSSGARLFGGIGPYVGYAIDGKIKSTNNGQSSSIKAFSQAGGFKHFDAGVALIAGYKTPNNIGISLGYEYGLANIAVSNAGGDKTKNRGFSLNISYDLDKILSGIKK